MAKYNSQKDIEKWRKEALKRRGRGTAEEITMDQAEKLMAQHGGGVDDEKRADKIVRLIESIDRKMGRLGELG